MVRNTYDVWVLTCHEQELELTIFITRVLIDPLNSNCFVGEKICPTVNNTESAMSNNFIQSVSLRLIIIYG